MFESLSPTFIIAILIALSVHECAHALVADKLGDPTAKYQGRVTLNPIAHLDPLGTILFLLVGFGWGKPVPVVPHYFKNINRDTALVSAAGPASNLLLAFLAFGLLNVFDGFLVDDSVFAQFTQMLLTDIIGINLVLMAFNLLPIAPLDGSKVLNLWIPNRFEQQYDELMARGPWILLGLIILGRVFNIDILSWWIQLIIGPILSFMDILSVWL